MFQQQNFSDTNMDNNKQRESVFVAFSQIIAVFVQNMITLSIGMGFGYTTILIPGITDNDSDSKLKEEQASWIGSIVLISCLIGCTMSGITEIFGKKRVMQIVMVPFYLSWILLYFANRVWHIYVTLTAIGIGSGMIQASVLSYIAEITQPHLRGMLSASTSLSLVFGIILEYLLGTILNWRLLALFSSFFPLVAFITLWFTPESPHWLIARNKLYQARKSLAWLRGWVKFEKIENEFQQLYDNHRSNRLKNDFHSCNTNLTPEEKPFNFKNFTKRSFLYPFAIISFLFFLINFTGTLSLQTYGIKIVTSLRVPINPYNAIFLMGIANLLGAIICILSVRYLGKRVLGFLSLFGICISNICLGCYAFLYNIKYIEFNEYQEVVANGSEWIPLVFMVLLAFSACFGLTTLPWMLIGEIYTYKTKSVATGLSSGVYFASGFLANKVFFNMISSFYLFGVFWFYGCMSLLGLIINYFLLPETEGKTLQQISDHFSGFAKLDNNVQRRK